MLIQEWKRTKTVDILKLDFHDNTLTAGSELITGTKTATQTGLKPLKTWKTLPGNVWKETVHVFNLVKEWLKSKNIFLYFDEF